MMKEPTYYPNTGETINRNIHNLIDLQSKTAGNIECNAKWQKMRNDFRVGSIKYWILLLIICVLYSSVVDAAHFVCGEVPPAADGTDSGWRNVSIFYAGDLTNHETCQISPETYTFCCDAESIPNHAWSIGQIVYAKVIDDGDGYIAWPSFVNTTGEGFDSVGLMELSYAINVNTTSPYSFPSNSTQLNITTIHPYTSAINYSLDGNEGALICSDCNETHLNISDLEEGEHSLTIFAFNASGFARNISLQLYSDLTPPSLVVFNPLEGHQQNQSALNFSFNITDNIDSLLSCRLYLSNLTENRTYNITPESANISYYEIEGLTNSSHYWELNCTDRAGHTVGSGLINFLVVLPPEAELNETGNETGNITNETEPPIIVPPPPSGGGGSSGGGGGSYIKLEEPIKKDLENQSLEGGIQSRKYPIVTKNPIFYNVGDPNSSLRQAIIWTTVDLDDVVIGSSYSWVLPYPLELPDGFLTYQVDQLRKTNLLDSQVKTMRLTFELPKRWLQDRSLDASNVTFFWYNPMSRMLEVNSAYGLSEEGDYYRYEFETDRFGIYVVALRHPIPPIIEDETKPGFVERIDKLFVAASPWSSWIWYLIIAMLSFAVAILILISLHRAILVLRARLLSRIVIESLDKKDYSSMEMAYRKLVVLYHNLTALEKRIVYPVVRYAVERVQMQSTRK